MYQLFLDLKTDEEKYNFFLFGHGYEIGVIAKEIQNDVAMAYQRCIEYKKELEALQKDAERYQYIRKGNQWIVAATQTGVHIGGEELDNLIDNDLEKQK